MAERLPYEEQLSQQWNDLPLPDENMAWADMRRRLDEDDDKPPVAWWRRGCMLWGLLFIAAAVAGWLLLKPQNWFRKENHKETIIKTGTGNRTNAPAEADQNTKSFTQTEATPDSTTATEKELPVQSIDTVSAVVTGQSSIKEKKNNNRINNNNPEPGNATTKKQSTDRDIATLTEGGGKKKTKSKPKPKESLDKKPVKPADTKKPTEKVDPVLPVTIADTTAITLAQPSIQKDTAADKNNPLVKKDSLSVSPSDSLTAKKNKADLKKDSTNTSKKTDDKKEKTKTPFIFSAGIAIHQQLPVGGQKLTPYNSLGRKASLADYIPSVYLRLEKESKWFLQSEFRYGAPQYTKEFVYRQSSVPDTGSNPVYTTNRTNTLKKTFYHQLPLTFNYFITPGWSVGAGVQWNKFVSAVSERQVSRKNNFTQVDSLVSKVIAKDDTAGSVFKKSYWQAVFETQYKWKRFSFGARYAFGLEPYIQFTLPGQGTRQERNHSLQLFIRYELWRQKKANK